MVNYFSQFSSEKGGWMDLVLEPQVSQDRLGTRERRRYVFGGDELFESGILEEHPAPLSERTKFPPLRRLQARAVNLTVASAIRRARALHARFLSLAEIGPPGIELVLFLSDRGGHRDEAEVTEYAKTQDWPSGVVERLVDAGILHRGDGQLSLSDDATAFAESLNRTEI